ncbi:MAG TPA: hypothetical protein VFB37_05425 [Steroidobacteraceae bacterium]|nr:hypothetical protein [Steroidobacteraceae bacterium]
MSVASSSPLSERSFVWVGIGAIVLIRLVVILLTPRTADFLDPRIYQGAGRTVLAGVNPYDYSDQPAKRAALRASMSAQVPGPDDFTQDQKSWDYYVSGNPPASTALYALFESIAHGSRFAWRLLLMLGDVSLFAGMVALVKAVRGPLTRGIDQAGIACLAIINPVLIVSGCAIPEDKQFQTALLLWGAALLLAPAARERRGGLGTGLVLSLSVLFKLLGAFLFPLWLARAMREGPRFAIWTGLGALLPVVAAFAGFGTHFISEMLGRAVQNSVVAPEHASPWVWWPALAQGHYYLPVKILVTVLFCATLAMLLARRSIDLLNFCAGLTVAFVCIWLDKGAMNRMNIGIVFATAALITLSPSVFLRYCLGTVLAAGVAYVLGVGLLHAHLETVDAVLALLFLVAYLLTLLGLSRTRAVDSTSSAHGALSPERPS